MQLQIDGLKGHTGTHQLAARTLLHGPNGSGKSTIVDALHLCLLGWIPRHRQTDIVKAIPGDKAQVVLQMDDEGTLHTQIERTKARARIKRTLYLGQDEHTGSSADEMIRQRYAPALLFCDFRKFLGLSGPERKTELLSFLPPGEDDERAEAMKRGLLWEVLRRCTKSKPRKDWAAARIWKELKDRLTEEEILSVKNACEALGSKGMTTQLHENAKEYKRCLDRDRAAVESLGASQEAIRERVESVPELEAEERGLQEKLAAAQVQATEGGQRRALAEQYQRQQREAENRLKNIAAMEAPEIPTPEKIADMDRAIEVHRAREPKALEVDAEELLETKDRLTRQLADTEREGRQYQSLVRQLADGAISCPFIEQDCPVDLAPYHDQFQGHLKNLGRLWSQMKRDLKSVQRELELSQERYQTARQTWDEWRRALETITEERRVAKAQAERYAEMVAERPRWEEQLASARQALAEMGESTTQPLDAELVRSLELRLDELRRKLQTARHLKAKYDLISGQNIAMAEFRAKCWRAAYDGARQGEAAYYQSRTDGIRDAVTAGLAQMGVGGEAVFDLVGSREPRIGVDTPKGYVDLEMLSSGQQICFAAALLAALPAQGGMSVLTMEVAEVDEGRMDQLLSFLGDTEFDLVVLASWVRPLSWDGWQCIEMPAAREME